MRIGFVHNLKDGGARRTMSEHMRRFDGDSVEVCLETALPVRADAIVVPLRLRAPALPHLLRPPARYRDLAAILHAWREAGRRLATLELDAVVAHPCQFIQAPPAIAEVGRRTLLFCHEVRRVDHELAAAQRRRALTRLPYAGLYSIERRADASAVAAAAALVTNSRYTAAGIRRVYRREATVIRLGVPAAFTPPAEPLAPRHVLSVGSLIASKGHDLVIESAARSRQRWPVVLVAPRPEPDEATRLQAIADRCGVGLVLRVGVSDTELRDLYREAVATLYLAEAEPLGLVSLEAQACGSPVIVSDEGGLPETLAPGVSGWVVPRDPANAARRLDDLDDPRRRATIVAAAAAHGASYDWDQSTRALETEIARLLVARTGA